MKLKLIHTVNNLHLENHEKVSMLKIKFRGSFVAEFPENIAAWVKGDILNIGYREQVGTDLVMTYYGNFRVLSVKAFNEHGVPLKITKTAKSDVVNQISSIWEDCANKYVDYDQTFKHRMPVKTMLILNLYGKKTYRDRNGKIIKKVNKWQLDNLDKIRGIYGTK